MFLRSSSTPSAKRISNTHISSHMHSREAMCDGLRRTTVIVTVIRYHAGKRACGSYPWRDLKPVRNCDGEPPCSSLPVELARFDNSQNVKMRVLPSSTLITLPLFRNSENVEMTALPSSVPRCALLHQKADLSFIRLWWRHQLPDCLEQCLDMSILIGNRPLQLG